jgi:hypothetical protein
MLRGSAQKMPPLVIALPPDDHGACSDSIGRPENSRVNRSLFNLDLYFGRRPIRHRSNALQKSVANQSLQIVELQRVFKIQLGEQGAHCKYFRKDMTDKKLNLIGPQVRSGCNTCGLPEKD